MYFQIEQRLNTEVKKIKDELIKFSNSEKLDNGNVNNFYQYLRFEGENKFYLGSNQFTYTFTNSIKQQISFLKIKRLETSSETLSGYKEIELVTDFKVDANGVCFWNGKQIYLHLIGITLINYVFSQID